MTTYVFRDGRVVEKGSAADPPKFAQTANLSSPNVSRMAPFASPVTGKEITSWRERDRDMKAANAVDPRDIPSFRRGRAVQQQEAASGRDEQSIWR